MEHDAYTWADGLNFRANTFGLTAELILEWEMFDKLCREGMEMAERKCRKLRRGATAFSKEFQKI